MLHSYIPSQNFFLFPLSVSLIFFFWVSSFSIHLVVFHHLLVLSNNKKTLFFSIYLFVILSFACFQYCMGSADPIPIQTITFPKMGTHKVKGLLKGLRYISQVFGVSESDDSKNQEIQIGAPTDVKHLAHVGCDGPVQDSPSWMREYGSPAQCQSMSDAPSDGPDWASEDSSSRMSRKDKLKHRHRRHRSVDNALDADSRNKDSPARQPRRRHTRSSYSERRHSDHLIDGDESPVKRLPEIPRKTRKKKPKEESGGVSSRSKADETCSEAD